MTGGKNNLEQSSIGRTKFFQPNWSDSTDTRRFIEQNLLHGEVLNFPCGGSAIGDVRADIDPSVNPDIVADIRDPPFGTDAFDTVYCDPPYSMHAFDKMSWAVKLWDIAKQRLILQTTTQNYRFPNAERTIWLADRGGSGCLQVIQIFDRENGRLSDYNKVKA